MKIYLLLVSVFFHSLTVHAKFLPDNEILPLSFLQVGPSNTSEQKFKEVLNEIQKIYEPVVATHGGKLRISGNWRDEKLNAAANQLFGSWNVVITGGLARRPELTTDGFILILCHELGHHLGGVSFASNGPPIGGTWAANEGQSDYFATQSCARKLWNSELVENEKSYQESSLEIRSQCFKAWSDQDSQNLCARILLASQSVAFTMQALKGETQAPSFSTPDPKVVAKTDSNHPATQCRMDTSMQGALCTKIFNENFIPGKNVKEGAFSKQAETETVPFTCHQAAEDLIGLRPACWFKSLL